MSSALRLRYNTAKAGIVTDPRYWATSAGYEFWCGFGHADTVASAAAANDGLDGYGWIRSLNVTEGSAGDLLSAADINPTRALQTSASDTLTSPRIFGSYDHGLQASRFLGYLPTKLTLEFYGNFTTTVAQANETTTFIGLASPACTDASAAGCAGALRSGGTGSTFFLTSDNGSDAGASLDASLHHWKIVYDPTNTEWFIDETSQGTITTEVDIWPQSFRWHSTSGSNDFNLVWARVFYS